MQVFTVCTRSCRGWLGPAAQAAADCSWGLRLKGPPLTATLLALPSRGLPGRTARRSSCRDETGEVDQKMSTVHLQKRASSHRVTECELLGWQPARHLQCIAAYTCQEKGYRTKLE